MKTMPKPMTWLEARVPLTLLIDLLDEDGPRSTRIYQDEPADLSWLPAEAAVADPGRR